MSFVICDPCASMDKEECGTACAEVCPVQCIYDHQTSPRPLATKLDLLCVHPYECVRCGACVPVCPVDAIRVAEEVPERWQHCIEQQEQTFPADLPVCPHNYPCPFEGAARPFELSVLSHNSRA